jgi:hypothetical protein
MLASATARVAEAADEDAFLLFFDADVRLAAAVLVVSRLPGFMVLSWSRISHTDVSLLRS